MITILMPHMPLYPIRIAKPELLRAQTQHASTALTAELA
jgi:hypothetical protein